MGKKKTKRELKKEQRQRDAEAQQAAEAAFEARRHKFRIGAAIVPVVGLAASLGVYFALDDRQLAALIGMIAIAIFIPVALGAVGGSIKPRDRTRAGSIDFGNKR